MDFISNLRYEKLDQHSDRVISLSTRLAGLLLLLWAVITNLSEGLSTAIQEIPSKTALVLIGAVILRIGIFTNPQIGNKTDSNKSYFSISRSVHALSGLILIAYLPAGFIPQAIIPVAIIILGLLCIVSGLAWFISGSSPSGWIYWIMGFTLLTLINSLAGNFDGNLPLLAVAILFGSLVTFNNNRISKRMWILILSLWALSTLPYSLSFGILPTEASALNYYYIPTILGYSLLVAGFINQITIKKKRNTYPSQPRWITIMYWSGLILIIGTILIFGLNQGRYYGSLQFSWMQFLPIGLAAIFSILYSGLIKTFNKINFQFPSIINRNQISSFLWGFYNLIRRIINGINFILEGDGGILWSLVLLLLFITLLSQISS
ncbi:hypothetical protein ACFLTX_01095 [Chloroflexota bacterium]